MAQEREQSDRGAAGSDDPASEPAMDPVAAWDAVEGDGFDTTGLGVSGAAAETEASTDEVREAWADAAEDVTEEDLRLMDPADRLEHDRDPREGE